MIKTIHHTAFTVDNLERSIAFYRDLLGMKVLWDSLQAGVAYKGSVCDQITGCPGTEQHLVYLGIGLWSIARREDGLKITNRATSVHHIYVLRQMISTPYTKSFSLKA
jgi:catechol 2,3-dioxygenase-like lactoylglutathione lyase family enzyme